MLIVAMTVAVLDAVRSIPWFPSRGQGGDVPDGDSLLDTEAVAAKIGVTSETVRIYLKRTRRRIAEGKAVRPQDLPLPDGQFGRSPAWLESTIDVWVAARPGRGRRPASS
ncbi:hypothetical protein [Streptomyces sp. NPDC058084]|uniref:hypothetical protein n=1 Tax=Streptomyces sp. NPDC058084 TaxID=3346333 RepID=UPI0036E5C3DE